MLKYVSRGELVIIKIFDKWYYQQDITDQKNHDNPLIIIKDICLLMLEEFNENPDTELKIIDQKPLGHPWISDDNKTLLLSTSGNTFWAQNAYQLSHELCHYFIKKKSTSGDNSWFEESLCELSSIYFLSRLSSNWEKSPNMAKSGYSGSIKKYYSNLSINKPKINLKSLNYVSSRLYKEMNNDPYLRDKNNFISNKMLPVFKETPTLWEDVYLIRQCDIKDLNAFFSEWTKLASNKNANAIFKISKLFL